MIFMINEWDFVLVFSSPWEYIWIFKFHASDEFPNYHKIDNILI